MQAFTKIIVFIIMIFIVNIVFYYISDDYRFFVKKIKNSDKVVYTHEKNINDKIIESKKESDIEDAKQKEKSKRNTI